MRNIFAFFLFLFVACKNNNSQEKHEPLPDKVQLIFTNESPYPITKITVFTNNFVNSPKNRGEKHILSCFILPQKNDTLFFDEFNMQSFSMRVFFLVGSDTIERKRMQGDYSGEYTLTRGIVKFGLYYSEKNDLNYTRETIKYSVD